MCIIADGVLSGGIRRAALLSLFSHTDNEMLKCKHDQWWEKHPYRARANNSAVLMRSSITKSEFENVFNACIDSNSGEPGFMWSNSLELGANTCLEIELNSNQFCNLTSVNLTGVSSKKDLHNRVYSAAMIGTLQASYTEFPYLNKNWKNITEKEALLGVSFTGIADNKFITKDLLNESAKLVMEINEKYAKRLGINVAARTTCVKPEGSASCVVGSSSGIHARHSDYYLRRVRVKKDDSLAKYLSITIPELVEDDLFSSTGIVVTIPQESPRGAVNRHTESAETLFNRIMLYNKQWVSPGHRYGENKHNVSCTISYKKEEIDFLRVALWENRDDYTGISLLPFDGGNYKQAPFEDCDKEIFDKYSEMVKEVDLTRVIEMDDNTSHTETLACSGGTCEII
jgi:ribonucleoside-diphosphate reductase alpha chain